MLFNSYVFIFIFLPVVLTVFLWIRKANNPVWPIGWLASASLFYYGWWQPKYLLLLLFSIGVNLIFGVMLINVRLSHARAYLALILGITFNLCLLGYFKYAGFLVATIDTLVGQGWPVPAIVLPIGISFITFQKIAFLVDAYRGQVKNFSLLNYALFVTFFPQLIAGPIVHHAEIMPQLGTFKERKVDEDIAIGASIFIVGLFKKVMVADTFAIYANAGYGTIHAGQPLDAASAWVAVLSYALQLYYDFSGYSDMALGLGRMFGIVLPVNFYSPYKSASIIEFWRRWHISLSRFLRDYLYIPLGGNKLGPTRRYINLATTMLLGGLWHGANWTFVIWGGLHGLMLMINHFWNALPISRHPLLLGPTTRIAGIAITFIAVTLAWVPFRAESFAEAGSMLQFLFPRDQQAFASFGLMLKAQFLNPFDGDWFVARELWPPLLPADYLAQQVRPVGLQLLLALIATFALPNTCQLFALFNPALGLPEEKAPPTWCFPALDRRLSILLAAAFVISVLSLSHVSPFLYFQF